VNISLNSCCWNSSDLHSSNLTSVNVFLPFSRFRRIPYCYLHISHCYLFPNSYLVTICGHLPILIDVLTFTFATTPLNNVIIKRAIIALMMKAARTSETLVNFYQTTRCYNPDDSHLHTRRRESLKSYNEIINCGLLGCDAVLSCK
jgi:hypothetical protein